MEAKVTSYTRYVVSDEVLLPSRIAQIRLGYLHRLIGYHFRLCLLYITDSSSLAKTRSKILEFLPIGTRFLYYSNYVDHIRFLCSTVDLLIFKLSSLSCIRELSE